MVYIEKVVITQVKDEGWNWCLRWGSRCNLQNTELLSSISTMASFSQDLFLCLWT